MRTLALLNGRRMANFASPGDDAGIDPNNIPGAAIARVEILLDGASAIWGTNAIGGTMNSLDVKGRRTLSRLAGARSPKDKLTLRAGIKNLANSGPPLSTQACFFISGYDPSYTDPHGRSFSASDAFK